MQTPDFTNFFLASAGAGAALVGLLFVAVSVNPGRNAGPSAPPERQAVAASAYTALINAFFISLVSLISADSLGGVAIIVGAVSLIATVRLVGDLFPPHLSRRIYARHAGFLAIGVIIYGLQVCLWLAIPEPWRQCGLRLQHRLPCDCSVWRGSHARLAASGRQATQRLLLLVQPAQRP